MSDDRVAERVDFVHRVREVVAVGGGDLALHLRAPSASGRRLHELALAVLQLVHDAGATLIVNDRCDVALAARADGVHLPERGLPPREARRLLGEGALLGRSVHLGSQPDEGWPEVLDYLIVGSVFATRSHPDREPAGLAILGSFADVGVPVIGIGGVTPGSVARVRAAGAAGIAVLSGIWDAPAPQRAVAEYVHAWHEAE